MRAELPKSRARRGEDGAVLITVLFIISIASAIVVSVMSLQKMHVESTSSLLVQAQAYEYALGNEELIRQILAADARSNPARDDLTQDWNQLKKGVSFQDGVSQIHIVDEQGLFNLNTLIGGDDQPKARFKRLLELLALPDNIADSLIVRLGTKENPRPLVDLDDLRTLSGLALADINTLTPYVTVLPEARFSINVNTASEIILRAFCVNDGNFEELESRIKRKGYITQAELNAIGFTTEGLTARSNYFKGFIIVQWQGRTVALTTLISRQVDFFGTVSLKVLNRDLRLS